MKLTLLLAVATALGWCQAVVVNRDVAAKESETQSTVLREDPVTGALELLVSYPAGHAFAPHSHDSNERIILLEGRLLLRHAGREDNLNPGGYAFLPKGEVQRLSCVSQTRCVFYVSWDGNPKSSPAP